jgi:peroxiredoxin
VVALLFAGKRILGNELSPLGVGVEAPNFSALTLDSVPASKSLAEYRGNVIMINIWATWCLPCRVEMPSIEQLHRTLGPKGLKVLGVSVDDPGTEAQIRDFVKQYGLTFEILHDPKGQEGDVSKDYQTTGYPETVIIGRDGIIRKKLIGASDWNSPENRGLVERLLAEKAD